MDREHLRNLLAQVGSRAQEMPESPSAESFDWRQCRYFTVETFEQVRQGIEEAMQEMAVRMGAVCQDDFVVELKSLEQQFGQQPLEKIKAMTSGDYALTFGPDDDRLEAVLLMPTQTASTWANLALGASSEDEEESDALLSELELTFLTDLSQSMVQIMAPICGVEQMATAATADNGPSEVSWTVVDALLCLSFEVKKAEAEEGAEACLILPCPWVAMDRADMEQFDQAPAEPEAVIKQCLQDYPVPVQVQVGTLEMSFEELASLEPNDILMLDRRVDEPVEISVCQKRAFAGTPAQRGGQKVVMITQAYH